MSIIGEAIADMKRKEKLLEELLAVCGFDVDRDDLTLEKRHFVSYGCKTRARVYDEWDDAAEYEEAKTRMMAEVEESLVDLVMYHDASFFVFSNDLKMLAAVREAMVGAISTWRGRQDVGEQYVARMVERGRYEEKIILEGAMS